jgi:hypothetical protein
MSCWSVLSRRTAKLAARPKCGLVWQVKHRCGEDRGDCDRYCSGHVCRCVVFWNHLSQHRCSCGSTRAAAKVRS